MAERAQGDRVSASRCLAFLYQSVQITITSPSPAGAARRADGGELKQLVELVRVASNELFEAVDPAGREDAKELLAPLMAALFCACDAHSARISRPMESRPADFRHEALTRMLYVFTSDADIGNEIGLDRRLGASGHKKSGLLSATKAGWKHNPAYGAHLLALSQLLTGLQKAEDVSQLHEISGSARLLFEDGPLAHGLDPSAATGGGGEADAEAIRRAALLRDPVDVLFSEATVRDIVENREEKKR